MGVWRQTSHRTDQSPAPHNRQPHVEFYSGDLRQLAGVAVETALRMYGWSGGTRWLMDFLQQQLADDIRVTILAYCPRRRTFIL